MTKKFKKLEHNCKFQQNLAKICDINIFRTTSSSPDTIQFPNSNLKEFHRLIKIYKFGT